MTRKPDPMRWSEQNQPDSPAGVRAGLSLYAARGPSSEQRERLTARLCEALERERAAPSAATSERPRNRGQILAVAGGVALLLGAALWFSSAASLHAPDAGVSNHGSAPSRATQSPPARPPTSEPGHVHSAPQPAAPNASVRSPAQPRSAVGTDKHRARASTSAQDPSSELRLLVPARRLIAADPARALALAREHERVFPRGAFAEERDLLALDALVRLGRGDEARQQAQRFRRAYPGSAHLPRVDAISEPR